MLTYRIQGIYYEVTMMQSLKPTRINVAFIMVTFLSLILLYQYYRNWYNPITISVNSFRKSSERIGRGPCREFWVLFPALRNFKLEDNIGGEFGRYPLSHNNISLLNISHSNISQAFMPTMTDQEKMVSLYVLQNFIKGCNQNNITFFIQGGTLLGSYRHHGFIPWDDDIDVYVDHEDKQKLYSLSKMGQGFNICSYKHFQWKFYNARTPALITRNYRWPYVDIFFYQISGDIIYDVTYKSKKRIFNYHEVFPLNNQPFEGAFLPGPCNVLKNLNSLYSRNQSFCHSGTYNHKKERRKKKNYIQSLPCNELYHVYPFVYRSSSNRPNAMQAEQLKQNNTVLHTLLVKHGCSSK